MKEIDYKRHNEEVREVWAAFEKGEPIRVPVIAGLNARFYLLDEELNTEGYTFEQYFNDPEVMLDVQLRFQDFVRNNVPQDAEMGPPEDGWSVTIDAQNVYDAAWWGCPIHFLPGQCPDTRPIYNDDKGKQELLERELPGPFDGLMGRLGEFYEYFLERKKDKVYKGKPIKHVEFGIPVYNDGAMDLACQLRGAENICMDMRTDPDFIHQLMDRLMTAFIERSLAWRKRLNMPMKDEMMLGADDFIMLLSVDDYKKFILPQHVRYYDLFSGGKKRLMHLCGNATRHFRTIRDAVKITHFDTGFPVDFGALREELGEEMLISGGPHVELLLNGTEEAIRERAREILASGIMRGGRFILREGNNYAPKTPLRNMNALYEAGKEFGRYK